MITKIGLIGMGLLLGTVSFLYIGEVKKEPPKVSLIQVSKEANLEEFISSLIEERNPSLPTYKKELIIGTLKRVSEEVFPLDKESQESYAVLIAIESGFNERATSKAGAVGLSQVIPRYSTQFMEGCGIKGFDPKDLSLMELNLKAGACQFKQLLKLTKSNTAASLVAYNAGPNSTSYARLLKGLTIENVEAANYPTKHLYLKEKVAGKQLKETEK